MGESLIDSPIKNILINTLYALCAKTRYCRLFTVTHTKDAKAWYPWELVIWQLVNCKFLWHTQVFTCTLLYYTKHISYVTSEPFQVNLTLVNSAYNRSNIGVVCSTWFHPAVSCLNSWNNIRCVIRVSVCHDKTFKAELSSEYPLDHFLIFSGEHAICCIVASHHWVWFVNLNCYFKHFQIYFSQSTFCPYTVVTITSMKSYLFESVVEFIYNFI